MPQNSFKEWFQRSIAIIALPYIRPKYLSYNVTYELYDQSFLITLSEIAFVQCIIPTLICIVRIIITNELPMVEFWISCGFISITMFLVGLRYYTFPIPMKHWSMVVDGNFYKVDDASDICNIIITKYGVIKNNVFYVEKKSVIPYKAGTNVPFNDDTRNPLKFMSFVLTSGYEGSAYFFNKNDALLYKMASRNVRKD